MPLAEDVSGAAGGCVADPPEEFVATRVDWEATFKSLASSSSFGNRDEHVLSMVKDGRTEMLDKVSTVVETEG